MKNNWIKTRNQLSRVAYKHVANSIYFRQVPEKVHIPKPSAKK